MLITDLCAFLYLDYEILRCVYLMYRAPSEGEYMWIDIYQYLFILIVFLVWLFCDIARMMSKKSCRDLSIKKGEKNEKK